MEDLDLVDASPTKEFFIEMLTRDIKLEKAILDLIDNSIDGAKKNTASEDFSGLLVDVKLNKESFVVTDNCGGFDLNTAKNYAFRFGRPEASTNVRHSVGRFGVGMKRALFKIGKTFVVESKCNSEHFSVEVNVDNWSRQNEWTFKFISGDLLLNPLIGKNDADGTIVKVTDLYPNIKIKYRTNLV